MKNNKQQTAVEWLEQEMLKPNLSMKQILKQAKEIEKEQKRKDFTDGYMHGNEPLNHNVIDKWYNETYGGDNYLCCTPEGQIKRYVNCIGCDRKPLIQGSNK